MIGRKTFLAFSMNLLKSAIGYVSLFFVARYMGPEALGIVGFGFSYVGIFNFVADLGFGVAHIKRMSEGRDPARCLGAFIVIRGVLTLMMIVTVLLSVYVYTHVLGHAYESPVHQQVIYIAILTLSLSNVAGIMGLTFAARRETARQTMPEVAGRIVEVSAKVAVAVLGLGVLMLAWSSLLGILVILAGYLFLFRGVRPALPTRDVLRGYVTFALPVMIIVSSNAVTENLDSLMIQFFWSSEELGYYVASGRIAMMITFAGTAIGMLIFPTVSAFHSEARHQKIRELTHRAERYAGLLLVPAAVLMTSFSSLVVEILLGDQFQFAGPLLAVLSWSAICYVLSVPYSSQIIGTGHERLSAILSLLLMITNVTLNLIFVPTRLFGVPMLGLGALGAAVATLLANLFMTTLYRFFAFRFTGTSINPSLIKQIAAGAAMLLLLHAGRVWIGEPNLPQAAVSSVLAVVVYVGILVAWKDLNRRDLAYLLNMISPIQMRTYVLSELGSSRRTKPSDPDGE